MSRKTKATKALRRILMGRAGPEGRRLERDAEAFLLGFRMAARVRMPSSVPMWARALALARLTWRHDGTKRRPFRFFAAGWDDGAREWVRRATGRTAP